MNTSDHIIAVVTIILLALSVKLMLSNFKALSIASARSGRLYAKAAEEHSAQKSFNAALELLRGRDEFAGALRYFRQAEAQLARSGIENRTFLAAILSRQALCLVRLGTVNQDEALEICERAVAAAFLSANEHAILDTLFTRSSVFHSLGLLAEAEATLMQCLAYSERLFGMNSEERGRILSNLGSNILAQSRYEDSLDCFRLALPILEQHTGEESQISIRTRDGLSAARRGLLQL